jgi:hypothetical protein
MTTARAYEAPMASPSGFEWGTITTGPSVEEITPDISLIISFTVFSKT